MFRLPFFIFFTLPDPDISFVQHEGIVSFFLQGIRFPTHEFACCVADFLSNQQH